MPDRDMTCPHCPDGHTPPDGGSQPWGAYVGPERDSDGQPDTIRVMRSAGAHVAESDAEWIFRVLNDPDRLEDKLARVQAVADEWGEPYHCGWLSASVLVRQLREALDPPRT